MVKGQLHKVVEGEGARKKEEEKDNNPCLVTCEFLIEAPNVLLEFINQ